MIKVLRVGCVFLGAAGIATGAHAKDPPSTAELITWVNCLKAAGLDPIGGRFPPRVETAFEKCSLQESRLRRAIARDPVHYPEYDVDKFKTILKAQHRDLQR